MVLQSHRVTAIAYHSNNRFQLISLTFGEANRKLRISNQNLIRSRKAINANDSPIVLRKLIGDRSTLKLMR